MMRAFVTPALALCTTWAAAFGPSIEGKSAIIIDEVSGKVLWEKDADTQRYPASTTKIMTALLMLEELPMDATITAPADTAQVTGSSLHLQVGERITVKDALYAMMLRSANDVCHAVALRIAGSDSLFADRMNERALGIGCKNTTFRNPNGLPNESHLTTARDLALIARVAMKNADFRRAVRTQSAWIERTLNQEDRFLENRNKWLVKDPTADGIKTGFTDASGLTYVGSATRNGFRVITVILNTPSWEVDHKAMLDWAYENYHLSNGLTKGAKLGDLKIDGGVEAKVPVDLGKDLRVVTRLTKDKPNVTWAVKRPSAPVFAGQRLGDVELKFPDGTVVRAPVVAGANVQRASFFQSVDGNGARWLVVGGAMLMGAWVMRRRVRTA